MRSFSEANVPLQRSNDGSFNVVPPAIGSRVHSWLKSLALKPNLANALCLASLRDGSLIAGRRSKSFTCVKLAATVARPMRTKLDPLIRMTFVPTPASTLAPMRSFASLESGMVARVFAPALTTAAPVPTNTAKRAVLLKLALHLPTHLSEPSP